MIDNNVCTLGKRIIAIQMKARKKKQKQNVKRKIEGKKQLIDEAYQFIYINPNYSSLYNRSLTIRNEQEIIQLS